MPTLFVKTLTVPPVPQKIVDTPSIIRKSLHRKWSQLAVDKLDTTKRNVRNSKDNWFPAAQPAWLAGIQKKWRHLRAWFVTKMNSLPSPRWRPCWCCHFLLVSRCGFPLGWTKGKRFTIVVIGHPENKIVLRNSTITEKRLDKARELLSRKINHRDTGWYGLRKGLPFGLPLDLTLSVSITWMVANTVASEPYVCLCLGLRVNLDYISLLFLGQPQKWEIQLNCRLNCIRLCRTDHVLWLQTLILTAGLWLFSYLAQ